MAQGPFIHSVDLDNLMVCNNFSIPTHLSSVMAANRFGFVQPLPTPIYDCDPLDLYLQPEKCISGVISPTSKVINLASSIRNRRIVTDGLGRVFRPTAEQIERILFKSELEIRWEIIRKAEFPSKPSRLTSIFVVENNFEGRLALSQMFSDLTSKGLYRPFLFDVKPISILSFHRADIQWLDEFAATKDENCIRSYWEGRRMNNNHLFEYVIEGLLCPSERAQVEQFRVESELAGISRKYWRDLHSLEYTNWFDISCPMPSPGSSAGL